MDSERLHNKKTLTRNQSAAQWRLKTWKLLGVDNPPEVDYEVDWKGVYEAVNSHQENKVNILPELISYNNTSGVKFILSQPQIPIGSNSIPILIFAADKFKDITILKMLLEQPSISSKTISYALPLSSMRGYTDVVRTLLEDENADLSKDGNESLSLASEYGGAEVVKLLLADKRIDPNSNDGQAFHTAVQKGYVEIVKAFLDDDRMNPRTLEVALRTTFNDEHGTQIRNLLLGSDKISLSTKLRSSPPNKQTKNLLKLSIDRLTKIKSTESKETLTTKYFWWQYLYLHYDLDQPPGDPLAIAVDMYLKS